MIASVAVSASLNSPTTTVSVSLGKPTFGFGSYSTTAKGYCSLTHKVTANVISGGVVRSTNTVTGSAKTTKSVKATLGYKPSKGEGVTKTTALNASNTAISWKYF